MKNNEIKIFINKVKDHLSDNNREYFIKKINSILQVNRNNPNFYSEFLNLFVHHSFSEEEAKNHWENILNNHKKKPEISDRDLHISMFDYFITENRLFKEPLLVEIRLFRETKDLVMRDTLTGLFNRRYFDITLEKELKRSKRYNKTFSIIIIDIDDFKIINDEKGHWFGDKILTEFSSILLSTSREEDTISRYGGEEFFILLTETSGDGAHKFASRLKENIHVSSFFMENPMTFSAGISTYPIDSEKPDILIKCADKALYAAKYAGKNCIIKHSKENRDFLRYEKHFDFSFTPIEYVFKNIPGNKEITKDISMGGLRFETDSFFDIGKKMIIRINLPKNEEITLISKVAWRNKLKDSRYSYGLKFNSLTMDQVVMLAKNLPAE